MIRKARDPRDHAIERDTEVPELIKADQVTDRIRAIYRRHRLPARTTSE